jgi:hypothetical protein
MSEQISNRTIPVMGETKIPREAIGEAAAECVDYHVFPAIDETSKDDPDFPGELACAGVGVAFGRHIAEKMAAGENVRFDRDQWYRAGLPSNFPPVGQDAETELLRIWHNTEQLIERHWTDITSLAAVLRKDEEGLWWPHGDEPTEDLS